jgi:hypothetical protein
MLKATMLTFTGLLFFGAAQAETIHDVRCDAVAVGCSEIPKAISVNDVLSSANRLRPSKP